MASLPAGICSAIAGDDGEEMVLASTNRRGREINCRVSCTAARGDGNGANSVWGVIVVMDEEHRTLESRQQ